MNRGSIHSMSWIRERTVLLSVMLLGCAPPNIPGDEGFGDDDEGGSNSGDASTSGGGTSSSHGTSGPCDTSNDESDDLVFIEGDHIDPPSSCNMIEQDCPEGEKCIAYDPWGGAWSAAKCVPVMGDQHVGDPCHWDGVIEGTDDCDEISMCWNFHDVEGETIGDCVPFCTGDLGDPQCPPGSNCETTNNDALSVCTDVCHPLLQDCQCGLGCYWADTGFGCTFTSGGQGTGDPCGFINDCLPGNFCLDAASLPDCAGAACCTNYCDVGLGDAECMPGTACVAFFDVGTAPPGYEDVGVCTVP